MLTGKYIVFRYFFRSIESVNMILIIITETQTVFPCKWIFKIVSKFFGNESSNKISQKKIAPSRYMVFRLETYVVKGLRIQI